MLQKFSTLGEWPVVIVNKKVMLMVGFYDN